MAEKYLVIDHLKFSYEGLFNLAEIYNLISSYFFEKGWDWYEKLNEEQVTSEGKQVRLILEPFKSASDYYKLTMRLKINFTDVKEVEVQHEKEILHLNQGLLRMTIDASIICDRKNKWKDKPLMWFMSVLRDRYLYKQHYAKFETWLKSDVDELYNKIKNYLNVFKYTYQT